ncbi:hypothetical protein GH714_010817 [Hevea brasiliensis]|uniref:Morc S5 domain-containing protein n=1 Tax=Hevea brasiliensis TaxID=3981 RepID=A0A6A6MDJ3_HEVBR|nr:hypothetical protein GH714_010817 [Hevea brasiliensis]
MASLKQQNREQSDIDHHVKDGDKRKLSSSSLVMLKKPKLEQFDSIVLARIRTVPESSTGPLVVVVNNKESIGMDHVRVHPKFLHSNATSHMLALGAFAKLLDNSLDEICNGATYVIVDVLKNQRDGSVMLLVEDGNGFKTSAMRLGADVVVLRCHDGKSQTQSIGLPSYTFFTTTGKEDIVVPMSPMASLKQQNREQSDIDHHVKDGDKRKLSSSSLVMLKKQKLEQFDSIVPAGFLAHNGGGMNPNKMRQCMSLGYSAKSKMTNTIGQYGNGFKISTMRLGADVVVFLRCNDGKRFVS